MMNPPAPQPTKKAQIAASIKKGAVRYSDVLLLLAGIALGFLGARI